MAKTKMYYQDLQQFLIANLRSREIYIDEKFIDFLNCYLDEQFYRSNFFELAGVL